MKFKIPLIGTIKTGKEADGPVKPAVNAIPQENMKDKEKLFGILGGMVDISMTKLSTEKTASTLLLQSNKDWVYRNNDVIAQEVSVIDFELYQVGLKKGEIVYTEIEEHPLLELLDKFNSTTTKADGIYNTQSHKKLTGDAFWLLARNGRQIDSIHLLQPDKVTLELGDPTKNEPMVKTYKYEDVIDGKKVQENYKPEDIIHFKKPNPSNAYRGLGVVEAVAETIDADVLTNTTQKNFFKKGAITNFVLTTDSTITEEQLKRLKSDMKANNAGARNAFEMMVLSGGLKPANISYSNRDLQLIDLLTWYRDKIMVGFGNTPASLGIIEDVNRANAEATLASWKRGTVKPDMDAIVNTLNEFLVPLFGKNLILGYVNPVPEDRTDDVVEATELKKAGIIKINEARELLGYENVEGGDIFAPDGASSVPGKPADQAGSKPSLTPNSDDQVDEEDAASEASKRRIFKKTGRNIKQVGNVPASLIHMDIKKILRKKRVFGARKYNHDLRDAVKPTIRKMLKEGKTKEEIQTAAETETEQRITPYFTNEDIMAFYNKQINVVDVMEEAFEKAVVKFIGKIEAQALENFDNELSDKTKRQLSKIVTKESFNLFDEEDLKVTAQLDLTPILSNQVVLAGQEAYRLIGLDEVYVPYNVANAVAENVAKFTQSMIDTDRETLSVLITNGLDEGLSVPQIRSAITSEFEDITRVQGSRITRTEVMRASNMGNLDAFKQSKVVKAKQWLTAGATDKCAAYEGKTEGLDDSFYEVSTFANGDPPLHPNCRCVLIPVLADAEDKASLPNKEKLKLIGRIQELEKLTDKRSKRFKKLKRDYLNQKADDQVYIKMLEKHLGLEDDE